jgi:hypothetical protein
MKGIACATSMKAPKAESASSNRTHDSPFKLIELAPGVSREEVREKTSANYTE